MTDLARKAPRRSERRICVTREMVRRRTASRAGSPASGRSPVATMFGPLFSGRLYLANLTFRDGAKAPHALTAGDLSTVLEYLALAAPPISRYAGQYGPNRIDVSEAPLSLSVPLGGTSYSDAQLQGWVNELAASAASDEPAAILVLNPPGLTNTDAKESGGVGVLGYHGRADVPYAFVNLLGSGFTIDDTADLYAEAVSHELAELTVDPAADGSNPEVCDGCGTNCQGSGAHRAYFDAAGNYLGGSTAFPPGFPYGFYLSGIAKPSVAAECPAPVSGCEYPPP